MIKVGDIITCPHCGAVLEVEKSDLYNLAIGLPLTQIYIKCPNCGQENVKYISTASRAISVGAVGLASNKIGKTYKCPKCGYMW